MAEFIERKKALEECDWYANEFCECEYAIMPLKGALENLPAADVRPVVLCVHEADGDIDWHNVCCITGADIVDVGEKMVDCPLVPIAPHGRLIDADALIREHRADNYDFAIYACDLVQNAPTVLEEEEGE